MGRIEGYLSKRYLWGKYILIFICVGSREYQFDRLLREIDKLIEENYISEEVFGQIGKSTYLPKYFGYKRFLDAKEFSDAQNKADIIISHGGTGSLISSLKLGKKVIAVPRLEKFNEHIDDHQIQVSTALSDKGYLKTVFDITMLYDAIDSINNDFIPKKFNLKSNVLNVIDSYIESEFTDG